jgi:[acyl-carrier-protein] S-malonyltransferase
MIAAWVDGEPVPAADVEAEVGRLRAGPLADRLPVAGTAGARQLRRWVTQRVVLALLLSHEADARGLTTPGTVRTPRPDAALVGAAAADVLATSAAARAVLATFATHPAEAAVRAHYAAHPDRYARPERWLVRQAFAPTADALVLGPPTEVDPATLIPELRTRPAGPVRSRLGWHRLVVDAVRPAGPVPYEQVRPAIEAELADRATQLAFARWLDRAAAGRIRLAPGFEHPADPRQPDATHRH